MTGFLIALAIALVCVAYGVIQAKIDMKWLGWDSKRNPSPNKQHLPNLSDTTATLKALAELDEIVIDLLGRIESDRRGARRNLELRKQKHELKKAVRILSDLRSELGRRKTDALDVTGQRTRRGDR